MPQCCVPFCQNRTENNRNKEEKLSFYRFPSNKKKRTKWLQLIRRDDFTPTCDTRVCSWHFLHGKEAGPVRFPWNQGKTSYIPKIKHQSRAVTTQEDAQEEHREEEELHGHPESTNCTDPDYVPSVFSKAKRIKKPNVNPDFVPSSSIFPKNKKRKQSNTETDGAPNKRKKEITSDIPEAPSSDTTILAGKDIEIEWPDLADLKLQHRQLQNAYTDLQAKVDRLSAKNEKLKEDLHHVLPRFSYTSVKWDDEQLLFLTGLHSLVFDWLVSQVAANTEVVHPELTSRDHLLMILMKVKLGLCDTDLAYRFGIRESSVTSICQAWLPALAAALKPLIAWPSAEIISASRPSIFKGKFRRCRCIVDCPEFVVARVGENEDKQESTVKYFASVTPAGAVSFLSSGYSSVIPERRILKESGFLHLVDPQDEILANGQIPIRDELASLGATLHIPDPNTGKQNHKSDSEKQFCHVWTHVKKVVGWWKEFNMLQKVIQEPYGDLLDDILIVCAVLTNVNLSLAPKGYNRS